MTPPTRSTWPSTTPTPRISRSLAPPFLTTPSSYATIAAYLRAMLEPEVTPACAWILAHLDYAALQRRWESDGSRLLLARGHVYRVTTS